MTTQANGSYWDQFTTWFGNLWTVEKTPTGGSNQVSDSWWGSNWFDELSDWWDDQGRQTPNPDDMVNGGFNTPVGDTQQSALMKVPSWIYFLIAAVVGYFILKK